MGQDEIGYTALGRTEIVAQCGEAVQEAVWRGKAVVHADGGSLSQICSFS